MANGGRVTYKDIMEMQKSYTAFQQKVFDELTAVRKDISRLREEAATDRSSTSALLRRDRWGYIWDGLNSLATAIAIGIWTSRR